MPVASRWQNPTRWRLLRVLVPLTLVAVGVTVVLYSFRTSLLYYYPPETLAEMVAQNTPLPAQYRLGGVVVVGSLRNIEVPTPTIEGATPVGLQPNAPALTPAYQFEVTDGAATFSVVYAGIVPDLFAEGQGVVVTGALDANQLFRAVRLLARHDENYVPVELSRSDSSQGDPSQGDPSRGNASLTAPPQMRSMPAVP